MIRCSRAPSSVSNNWPVVALSSRPTVEMAGSRLRQRSGNRSNTSAPSSLCEQVMPSGLCIIITSPGRGSSGSPSISIRDGRSGESAIRFATSVRSAPSSTIPPARAIRAISVREP